jgi:hypothetical protein
MTSLCLKFNNPVGIGMEFVLLFFVVNWLTYAKSYLHFLFVWIPFYLQAVQIHSANGVKYLDNQKFRHVGAANKHKTKIPEFQKRPLHP